MVNATFDQLSYIVNRFTYRNYEKHLKDEIDSNFVEEFFKSAISHYGTIGQKFKELNNQEYVTVDDYIGIIKNITLMNKQEMKTTTIMMINNQDEFINQLLTAIAGLYGVISDKSALNEIINKEPNAIKRTYFVTVMEMQKKLLLGLKKELENNKKNFGLLSKIPIINAFVFAARISFFKKLERASAANNILVLRYLVSFDKEKIKKEINQAFEEFAKAGLLEETSNYNEYNKYIGGIIKA
ncbi:MAG: hypothetical protein Q7S21_05400 [archaeon]|nr:hypothetical protein [archaeon]